MIAAVAAVSSLATTRIQRDGGRRAGIRDAPPATVAPRPRARADSATAVIDDRQPARPACRRSIGTIRGLASVARLYVQSAPSESTVKMAYTTTTTAAPAAYVPIRRRPGGRPPITNTTCAAAAATSGSSLVSA